MSATENSSAKIEQIVLDLLANSLFGAGKHIECDSVKWPLVWRESYVQGVSLTAFSGSAPESCSEQFLYKMRGKLQDDLRSVVHVNKEHLRLHRIMAEANIPYVILKGAASAAYYPDPIMRVMGDVDFLVDEADVPRACSALEANGLKRNPKEHEKHIVYYDDMGNFEMHTTPAGVPKGKQGEPVRKLLRDIIKDARPLKTDFGTIMVPSDFHHGLVILLHTCSHFTSEGIGLRQLCDWAVFASRFSDDEFKALFEDAFKSIGLWRFAQVLSEVCRECLGMPRPSFADACDPELINDFTEDIFKSGNLGQKNATSVQETILTQKDSQKSYIGNVIASVNQIVYFHWQFTRRLKFLLPIGWLFFGGRYVLRSLMGKRPKIDAKKIKDRTEKRNSLYEEIKLFKE